MIRRKKMFCRIYFNFG